MKILVTGGTGFIGRHLTSSLLVKGHKIRITGHESFPPPQMEGVEWYPFADFADKLPDWNPVLEGMDAVIHLAGMAHRQDKDAMQNWEGFDRVNHLATAGLAQSAACSPLKRFVNISSVAVHGSPTHFPLHATDPFLPDSPYGKSKLDAETALRKAFLDTHIRWAILRPVVVYGPGNPGNMARLQGLLRKGLPIPVGQRPNRRGVLYVGNLVHAIIRFIEMPDPPSGKAWLIADSETPSTEQIVISMARAMSLKPRIVKLPDEFLKASARIGDLLAAIGFPSPWTEETRHKLLDDYFVDTTPIQQELGWRPPSSFTDAMRSVYATHPVLNTQAY